MAVSEAFVVNAIAAASPAFSLTQLANARLTTGGEELKAFSAGHPFAQWTGLKTLAPMCEFTTAQLATLLANCPPVGVDLSGGDVLFELRKILQHSTRDSSDHLVGTAPFAFMYWDNITLPHNEPGTASGRVALMYDGTNAPVSVATGVLAGTPQAAEQFCAGPLAINGTAIAGVQNISIQTGLRWVPLGGDGEVYPTLGYVEQIDPVITVRVTKSSYWSTVGGDGLALTSLALYGRRMKLHDTRYANNTGNHLKFSATAGLVTIDDTSGGNNNRAETTLRISLTAPDASTAPLIVQTGQQIS